MTRQRAITLRPHVLTVGRCLTGSSAVGVSSPELLTATRLHMVRQAHANGENHRLSLGEHAHRGNQVTAPGSHGARPSP